MTTPPTSSIIPSARQLAFAAIAFLSLYLPFLVARWSIITAFSGLGPGAKVPELKSFAMNCIQDGEAWFNSLGVKGQSLAYDNSIKRLNFKTGMIRETNIHSRELIYSPLALGHEMYAVDLLDIYKINDGSFVKLGEFPEASRGLRSNLFLFDDKLTLVSLIDEDRFRLIHLVDGQWIDGREVLMPNRRQRWYDDPQSGKIRLLPRSSRQPDPAGENRIAYFIQVDNDRQQAFLHVSFVVKQRADGTFEFRNLFRRGFEFADESGYLASALAPENSAGECSGWEPMTTTTEGKTTILDAHVDFIHCDASGPLFGFTTRGFNNYLTTDQICRRDADGHLHPLSGLTPYTRNTLAVDPSDKTAYVIEHAPDDWNAIAFRRIDGDTILPAFLTLQGGVKAYLDRWRFVFWGMLLACLFHFLLMTVATFFLTSAKSPNGYEYDYQLATIAPIWRRTMASLVDLLLFIAVLIGLWYGLSNLSGSVWTDSDNVELCDRLHTFRSFFLDFFESLEALQPIPLAVIGHYLYTWWQLTDLNDPLYALWFGTALLFCSLNLFIEGRYGITVGKWLLRIRTVSSTLNPAGFMKAVGRAAFCPIDFFCFLTPIPAIVCTLMSKGHRRLGDHFANTTVVNAGSIHNADWYVK